MKTITALWRQSAAVTSIEYAMIAFFLSISIVVGVTAIGTKLNAKIAPIAANLN